MYLKALEIQGFKSFPEKTRIAFPQNITAIVGPNGSGKSNISDAILWVLGEQRSRTLRGSKMEDVIFGGTQKRAALGFAQVSLIIDNSGRIFNLDQLEIAITRRYYRSGESEYYINRKSVRLKDIVELLMDTGLGRDGYSVISQGRIAEVISGRSVERRDIFEEAAGISRFRYRKEEAERRLNRTDENLLRVNDKIDELELQIEPLRAQSETAKRFLVLRDELRILEVSLWLENLDKLRESSESIERSFGASKAELSEGQKELSHLYAETESISEKMRDMDLESEAARAKLSETEALCAQQESAAAVLRNMLESNRDNKERVEREMLEAADKHSSLKDKIAERENRIIEIDAICAGIDAEICGIRRRSEENDREIDGAMSELSLLISEESKLSDALLESKIIMGALSDAALELKTRETAVTEALVDTADRIIKAEDEHKSAQLALVDSKKQADELQNVVDGNKLRVSGREDKTRELSEKLTKLTIELNSMDSRVRMLSEMQRDYEGFSLAVKTLMKEQKHGFIRGIHGPVASLLQTEGQYALAIETALGAAAQNIIVETQETGRQAIEFLKKREAGRATFLPLSVVRGNTLSKLPVGEDGYLGLALHLLQFDKKYEAVFASLLGRTIVVETLSDALRISRKNDNRFRIVTLDGQLINAGGSMTGGSSSRNSGIISRASEQKRLSEQLLELKSRESGDVSALSEAERELAAARYVLEAARAEVETARERQGFLELTFSAARMTLASLEEKLISEEAEKAAISQKILENSGKAADEREKSERLESELSRLREEIDKLSEGREEIRRKGEALSEGLSRLREQNASLKAERGAVLDSKRQLEAMFIEMNIDSDRRKRSLDNIIARNQDIEADLSVRENRRASLADAAIKLRECINGLSGKKMELEGNRVSCEKKTQEKNRALIDMERVCAGLEQKKLAFDMEEGQIIDRLWDTYELSRTAAAGIRQSIENLQKAARRVYEIRREISALGNVNIGSIGEYERVRERYDFLCSQRDDVIKAKTELLKIISDITREMKIIFLREFKLIDECFRETFCELFGGGKAALLLEDEDNILSCGIEIKVQPPGKALTTISLLSGGEMAFVAIALYFAILKTHPTPFCLMDEIEAALDESNVIRFAEYLRHMSERIQFIVITHRRRTMEEANTLYGVTMQEKGVSRIISVSLEEAEKTIA